VTRTDARGLPTPHPRIRLANVDAPIPKMRTAHTKALAKARTTGAPTDFLEAAAALGRFLELARA
jgi:hypothetical protein